MKTGRTLMELATELDRQRKEKKDFIAPTTMLSVHSNGVSTLKMQGAQDYELQETAHDQIADRLQIPKKYYDKMRSNAPELLDSNINHWLSTSKEKRMIRTLDGKARAFLSDRFRPLDNYDLADVVLPELTRAGCEVTSCEVTESRMYLKATTERLTFEVKQGDVVQAGIVISNSEIGKGALKIEPMLYRLVCLNGAIMNDAKMQKFHVGRSSEEFNNVRQYFRDSTRRADDKAFWLKVQDTVRHAFSTIGFERYVQNFINAQKDIIEVDSFQIVEVAAEKYGLAESESKGVLASLLRDGEMTRFGLANAVTHYAQEVESYDRSTELERIGGAIIELPRTDWATLNAA